MVAQSIDVPADLHKDRLDAAIATPVREHREFGRVDPAVHLVDKRQVDLRDKLHRRGLFGVVLATSDLQAVDAVLVHGMRNGERELAFAQR